MQTANLKSSTASVASDQQRWEAVQRRDANADGKFVTAVMTTGIYCRPSCPARHPLRKNVVFFSSPSAARAAGYRSCKRCKPDAIAPASPSTMMVEAACRSIEGAAGRIGLDALAAEAKMSPSHFHRTFRAILGITPKQYEIKIRRDRARDNLADGSITTAIYKSGYSSSSRFYESTDQWLGMKPSVYRRGAQEQKIRYAIGTCSLGSLLVATSEKGICSISLGGSTTKLLRALRNTFPNADVTPGDKETKQTLVQVISLVESPTSNHSLPLDICGTAFQQRVWLALQKIPAGTTLSYQELASRIGRPNSARAVANACAANKLAVAIPCHRIVRNDGTLSGYRWGADRKRKLLELEANQSSR